MILQLTVLFFESRAEKPLIMNRGVENCTALGVLFNVMVAMTDLRPSGLAKTIMQGTVKGERRQSRQRKRWEDNIREWTGLEFAQSERAAENRENGGNGLRSHLWCPNEPGD